MCLTRSGCTHGRQQELLGDEQGDEKREKRHFQLQCHWPDCWLLFAIAAAARCAPAGSAAVPAQLQLPCHAPSGRKEALPWLCLAGLEGLAQAAVAKSQEGSRTMGRGRARRQLPSCPSLPGRGVTSSTRFCQALPGAGALPGTRGCSRREQRGIWDQQEAPCQCHVG